MVIWTPGMTLEQLERQTIMKAIAVYGYNKSAAARALGITYRTIENKMVKYEKDDEARKEKEVMDKAKREAQLMRARGLDPTMGTVRVGPKFSDRLNDNEDATAGKSNDGRVGRD